MGSFPFDEENDEKCRGKARGVMVPGEAISQGKILYHMVRCCDLSGEYNVLQMACCQSFPFEQANERID